MINSDISPTKLFIGKNIVPLIKPFFSLKKKQEREALEKRLEKDKIRFINEKAERRMKRREQDKKEFIDQLKRQTQLLSQPIRSSKTSQDIDIDIDEFKKHLSEAFKDTPSLKKFSLTGGRKKLVNKVKRKSTTKKNKKYAKK